MYYIEQAPDQNLIRYPEDTDPSYNHIIASNHFIKVLPPPSSGESVTRYNTMRNGLINLYSTGDGKVDSTEAWGILGSIADIIAPTILSMVVRPNSMEVDVSFGKVVNGTFTSATDIQPQTYTWASLFPSHDVQQPPQPLVAIHVSELTQALETMPAVAPTPTGSDTSGYEWWYTSWHYFVAYESLKDALRSDGTPFVEVSDSDIASGLLLNSDGSPRYPIVISLASEAMSNTEVAPLRAYVNAGGFLFVGSSSFTRNPNGTTRGDFALASEMGLHMTNASLQNWY